MPAQKKSAVAETDSLRDELATLLVSREILTVRSCENAKDIVDAVQRLVLDRQPLASKQEIVERMNDLADFLHRIEAFLPRYLAAGVAKAFNDIANIRNAVALDRIAEGDSK